MKNDHHRHRNGADYKKQPAGDSGKWLKTSSLNNENDEDDDADKPVVAATSGCVNCNKISHCLSADSNASNRRRLSSRIIVTAADDSKDSTACNSQQLRTRLRHRLPQLGYYGLLQQCSIVALLLLIGLSLDFPQSQKPKSLAAAWRYIYSANIPQGQCLYADFDSSPHMQLSVRGRRPPSWLQQRQKRDALNETSTQTGESLKRVPRGVPKSGSVTPSPPRAEIPTLPPPVEPVSPSPSNHTRGPRRRRIVNGEPVDVAQWPFLVAILTPDGPINSQGRKWDENCGGVIVHREFILTAAHCVIHTTESSAVMRNPQDLLVRVGDFNLYSQDRNFEDIVVDKTFQHPRYNPFQIDHGFDVALLHLSRPVSQSAVVPLRTACLPPPGLVLPNEAVCMVAGWGATQTDGNTSAIPLFTRLKLVPYTRCRDLFDMAPEVGDGRVFCAGPPGPGPADTCQGDSGSPIFCHVPAGGPVNGAVAWTSIWQLYGVVSFGGDLCGPVDLSPSVYTSVVYFRQWLTETIANEMALRGRSDDSGYGNNLDRRRAHRHPERSGGNY